jgi:hypothetical protein
MDGPIDGQLTLGHGTGELFRSSSSAFVVHRRRAIHKLLWPGESRRGTPTDGTKLSLLRIEINDTADVGGTAQQLGAASFRCDPLPGRVASRRAE